MSLNAQLYSKLVTNQPNLSHIGTCAFISGNGTNAFVITDLTAIRRADILAETKAGVLTNGLTAMTVLSTLADGQATVSTPGTGYNNGTFTNVVLTNGGIATGRATVAISGGAVQSVFVTDGGTEYALSSTGVAICALSGGDAGGIGAGSGTAAATIALTTGTGTGTIAGEGWVVGNACKAFRLLPAALANLGSGFPTSSNGFRISLREAAGKSCLAMAYTTGPVANANMTCTRVSAGVYKFSFNASRVSGGLPPVVDMTAALRTGQGPGVSAGSYASTVFSNIGLDGKTAGGVTFGVEADPLYVDPINGDLYVLCVDHNNLPRDPYPGSHVSVSVMLRNSSAAV